VSDVALRFGAKDDGLTAQFRKVDQQLDRFKANATGVASSIGTVFKSIAGLAVVAGLAKAAGEALEFADAQKKMQAQTGLSVETTQKLAFIAGQTSVEVGSLTSGVLKLQRVLGGFEEGSDKSAAALKRLNLANAEFTNRNPEEQFNAVAKAVSGLATQNEKVLAVTELFGKAGAELLPVLDAIGTQSAELEAQFDAIGGPVGQGAIDAVDNLGDQFATTALAAKSLTTEILAIIAPPVVAGLKGVALLLAATRHAITGGSNEQVNLDNRINELSAFIKDPLEQHKFDQGRHAAVRKAIAELEELRQKQEELSGTGLGGLLNPKIQQFPVNLPNPLAGGDLQFQETDEDRAKRLKEEEQQRNDRINFAATVHQIEEDMAFRSSLKLADIDQKRLDDDIKRTTEAEGRKLKIVSDMQGFLSDVRRTFGLQEIKFEEIKDQSILEIASGMFGALARENTKLAKIQQGIALAQTIWSTATGIMKAFETLPWPANLAAAAKVALTGAIQVAKIKSTNYNAGSVSGTAASLSGGSTVGTSSNSGNPDTPDSSSARGSTNVYISGFITKDIVDYIMEGIRENFDRDVVLIPQNSRQAEIIRGNA
jgi:hypothetical protein